MRKLRRAIDDVLFEHNIANDCRIAAINIIAEFVDTCCRESKDDDDLVQLFFGYIMEKISERTDLEDMNQSFNRAIAAEKRGYADPINMSYHLAVGKGLPFYETTGFFGDTSEENYPKMFPVYGEAWTYAYEQQLCARVEREIYRLFSVNVNDPLIRDTFELAFRFFQGKNFATAEQELRQLISKYESFITTLNEAEKKGKMIKAESEEAARRHQQELERAEEKREAQRQKREKRNRNRFDFS